MSNVIPFADDFLLLAAAKSRRTFESSVNGALRGFVDTSNDYRLEVSVVKTEAVLFGRGRKLARKPSFRIGKGSVKIGKTMRYLGVTIDENLSWIPHIEGLRSNMITLYKDLSAFKTRAYDLPQGLVRLWYLVVGEKRLSYAAPCWAHKLNAHAIRKLRSAQRTALLYVVGAYRRTSTEAL